MSRRTLTLPCACFVLLSTGSVYAQLIVPVSQTRTNSIVIDDFFSGAPPWTANTAAPDLNPWSDTLSLSDMGIPSSFGDAMQNSSINLPNNVLAASAEVSGSASWSSGDTRVISESVYRVVFDVMQPFSYLATGRGDTNRFVGNALESFTTAGVSFRLYDVTAGTTVVDRLVAIDDGGSGVLNEAGTLPAGRYEVAMFAGVDVYADFNDQFPGADASLDIRFEVSPVPEPMTLALIGIGLGCAVASRRFMRSP